ncbi:20916_t:CDS:2 [Cetraspora pellucida]|uniref:20916_t:CDS:1 n=1 Tax=Cetraspora pellucida TaxID=1433469 RepID=A0A9N9HVI3_9GLOM|nr:20916_t:CDS:2 [Cetraspora pellucida]
MSMAKTSIQVAVSEGVTEKLTEILVQFIIKYCHNTGLGIKKISLPLSIFFIKVVKQETSLLNMASEVLKPFVEEHNKHHISSSKTCSYCLGKCHNIHGYSKYNSELADKENH